MTKQDYRVSVRAPVAPIDAYDKIARISEWWAKDFEGGARNLGDLFTVRFGDTYVDFKVTEAVPGRKLVWHVTNCYLPWLKDKTEWNGTNVIFEVSAGNGETTVTMTHEGLVPDVECFDTCVKGWNEHFGQDFKQFLIGGSVKLN